MAEQNLFSPTLDEKETDSISVADNLSTLAWVSSETEPNTKNIGWYLMFVLSILLLCTFIYFFTRSLLSSIAIFIIGITITYTASRRPRDISYSLNSHGITINNINHHFSEYKSYNLVSEDNDEHIILMSVKRFTPNKVIYFRQEDRQKIIALLSEFLPIETPSDDQVGKLMKRIGF